MNFDKNKMEKTITVRLTLEQYEKIKYLDISKLVRFLIDQYLKKILK